MHDLYIDGTWRTAGSPIRIDLVSPSTEECVGSVGESSERDVDDAVAAARRALESPTWAGLDLEERIALVRLLADAYAARFDEIVDQMTADIGLPIRDVRAVHARAPRAAMLQLSTVAEAFPWTERRPSRVAGNVVIRQVPVGVVAAIVPWNAPLLILVAKAIPALLAGCTVVVKPSPEASRVTALFASLLDDVGFPAGAFNLISGTAKTGARLVEHPGIDKVTFTGSTAAGREVAATCGKQLKRVALELGGKSAAIVLEDADLDHVLSALRIWTFGNSGQSCLAQTRILVPRRRHDEFADALGELASGLVVGDPTDDATDLGPVVSQRQRDRVLDYVSLGLSEGASLVAGGADRPPGLSRGFYVRPSVLAGVANSMRVAREEIFGPVAAVIPYDDEEQAVAIANDSDYGLAGAVWTPDLERGAALAARIRSGTIGVNRYALDFGVPFGGFKASGIGREYGPEGIQEFVEVQAILGAP